MNVFVTQNVLRFSFYLMEPVQAVMGQYVSTLEPVALPTQWRKAERNITRRKVVSSEAFNDMLPFVMWLMEECFYGKPEKAPCPILNCDLRWKLFNDVFYHTREQYTLCLCKTLRKRLYHHVLLENSHFGTANPIEIIIHTSIIENDTICWWFQMLSFERTKWKSANSGSYEHRKYQQPMMHSLCPLVYLMLVEKCISKHNLHIVYQKL